MECYSPEGGNSDLYYAGEEAVWMVAPSFFLTWQGLHPCQGRRTCVCISQMQGIFFEKFLNGQFNAPGGTVNTHALFSIQLWMTLWMDAWMVHLAVSTMISSPLLNCNGILELKAVCTHTRTDSANFGGFRVLQQPLKPNEFQKWGGPSRIVASEVSALSEEEGTCKSWESLVHMVGLLCVFRG